MRKVDNGEEKEKKEKKREKITAEIVATTSLPVDRLTATDCNAAARANKKWLPGGPKMADRVWRGVHS